MAQANSNNDSVTVNTLPPGTSHVEDTDMAGAFPETAATGTEAVPPPPDVEMSGARLAVSPLGKTPVRGLAASKHRELDALVIPHQAAPRKTVSILTPEHGKGTVGRRDEPVPRKRDDQERSGKPNALTSTVHAIFDQI